MTFPDSFDNGTWAAANFRGSDKADKILKDILVFIDDVLIPFEANECVQWGYPVDKNVLKKVWKMSADRGFYSLLLPESLGGAGLSMFDLCAVKEAVVATNAVLSIHVLGELSGPPRIGHLFNYATELHVSEFLNPVCRAEKAACFALTEVEAGSDATAIQTQAVRDGDHFIINGAKRFISGAPYADFAVLLAVTDPDKVARGISALYVDLSSKGCEVRSDYEVLSGQGSHGDIILEDVRVPVNNLIGEQGTGFKMGMARITLNRLLHCATMLGYSRLVTRLSLQHATTRKQFGQPIGQFQAVQHMLATMNTDMYAARSMMFDAASRHDAGQDIRMEASMCKLLCGETSFRIADTAVQVNGGQGLLKGTPVEYLFRFLRFYRIVTGTSEIQRNTIAKGMMAAIAPAKGGK